MTPTPTDEGEDALDALQALAEKAAKDMRAITRCWRYNGYHVYKAGPCFDTYEQAIRYRNQLDKEGVTWKSQLPPWA